MTVATLLIELLFHFIGRFFSIALWLGTFEFGARGFAVVSACAGGLVIKLGDAYGFDIVVARSQSKSLFCNFIQRLFAFAFRLDIFGFDAPDFAAVSVCAYNLAIELAEAHGFAIIITFSRFHHCICRQSNNTIIDSENL